MKGLVLYDMTLNKELNEVVTLDGYRMPDRIRDFAHDKENNRYFICSNATTDSNVWTGRFSGNGGTISDFADGTLVATDIVSNTTNGNSYVIEVNGKSYANEPPFAFKAQGYLYNNTIISHVFL